MTKDTRSKPEPRGKWFAPSSGGYSGLSQSGRVVPRPPKPPTDRPATAAGVSRQKGTSA
jgi:hypothetical protein